MPALPSRPSDAADPRRAKPAAALRAALTPTPRTLALTVCAGLVTALLGVAAVAPLPFSVAQPGQTVDVLGESRGKPVISVPAARDASTGEGELLMTTIAATMPDATVRLPDVVSGWFATDQAVMPRESVYPVGDSPRKIRRYNERTMRDSQDVAVRAALGYLHRSPRTTEVTLRLENIGGPSAGLLFALGVIEKLGPDGSGDAPTRGLTGGRVIAGTGTIDADGTVGPVGGVPLKTQAARRDGATVFLVPKAECADAASEVPPGLRLVPVSTLRQAVDALTALRDGGRVPRC